ncbi:ROK family transcriptional regulator [Isoptericola croceus]|uniref:ROK family transcriptional regulator n=1 Tax=Isoptericola croceus TaxID=3031406 RepID=UPI0023F6E3D2|nr:ROK family protein [Isoptericola croceus]
MTTTTTRTSQRGLGGGLRATSKVLPEHARAHNRSLVLQHLFHEGPTSRAGLARATGLTRVTISDLVGVLLAEDLVEELGTQPGRRVGKPAILVGMRTDAYQIVAVDLSDDTVLRGAVLTLTGEAVVRRALEVKDRRGDELVDLIARFARRLVAAATRPVIGVGIGSPGVVDPTGRVVEAPNVGWKNLSLAATLTDRLGLPVHVANDANSAALAEYTYGGAADSMLVLTVGQGVGAGVMVDGARVHGAADAAGELGHVTAVEDGELCACGRRGCLETVLSAPALRRAVHGLDRAGADAVLADVGRTLGKALAPVVGALNLGEVLLSGPPELLGGALRTAAHETLVARIMPATAAGLNLRMASLDDDVVLAGAAVLVLGAQLGVS